MNSKLEHRFWNKVNKMNSTECWNWNAALNKNGYGWFAFNTKTGSTYAHRVAALLSGIIDSIDCKLHVLHSCDNPKCCNPDHLFAGTNFDNVKDRVSKDRTVSPQLWGDQNGASKLTNDQIKEIRIQYKDCGLSQSKIAAMFGVKQPQISRIVNGQRCGGVL